MAAVRSGVARTCGAGRSCAGGCPSSTGWRLRESNARLQAIAGQFQAVKSFAELHRLIERHVKPIRGIGDLAVYDIAHRIDAYLRHEPEAVYLGSKAPKSPRPGASQENGPWRSRSNIPAMTSERVCRR
jgi:hypothetical protein